jgi:hypothetical protein
MARGERNRRGGSSSGGRGDNQSRDVLVSKALSKLLRHGAEKEGLKLGPGGYINVNDVVSNHFDGGLFLDVPRSWNVEWLGIYSELNTDLYEIA